MQTNLPTTSSVYRSLLRADLTTQWRNRRASFLVLLVPSIILISWKGLVAQFGSAFVLSNCITVGLTSVGLLGYSNSVAKDRDKGIFQRLRVAPAPNWTIMGSRLTVQIVMIILMTILLYFVGYSIDKITLPASGYVIGFVMSLLCGAVYLSLGQVIVGLIKNPETVNATSRLIYFAFIMIGMFTEFGAFPDELTTIIKWSPYGTVKRILSDCMQPGSWNGKTTTAVFIALGYTVVFTIIGIRKFRWSTR